MTIKFIRELINVEIKLGFLHIPSKAIEYMPNKNGKIKIKVDNENKELSYNADYRRIFGLTSWYKKLNAKAKSKIEIIINSENNVELKSGLIDEKLCDIEKDLNLSGLSTQAKGDIVEDRIKEFLLLQGQGLLSIYKPVSDTEGIDLIVVRNGRFHPIFLQVKGRYNLQNNRSLIISVKLKTFTPHANYFVIGAYFNPKTLEINQKLILIPSEELVKNAIIVKSKVGEWYRVVTSLNSTNDSKWSKYIIDKGDLASILLDKFDEMDKYVK
jgi:hypothetical protein